MLKPASAQLLLTDVQNPCKWLSDIWSWTLGATGRLRRLNRLIAPPMTLAEPMAMEP
jgi:hypothetical protein